MLQSHRLQKLQSLFTAGFKAGALSWHLGSAQKPCLCSEAFSKPNTGMVQGQSFICANKSSLDSNQQVSGPLNPKCPILKIPIIIIYSNIGKCFEKNEVWGSYQDDDSDDLHTSRSRKAEGAGLVLGSSVEFYTLLWGLREASCT
jgi:hypothetical protein